MGVLRAIAIAINSLARWMGWVALFIAPPVLRAALGIPFLRSGLTRWTGFLSLSPVTPYMFAEMFKLHLFGHAYSFPAPDVVAYIDAVAEIVLPGLLFLGLATRFSAFGLLVMTAVIQLTAPSAWETFHLPWAGLAIAIIAIGPGVLSLDHWIARACARRPARSHAHATESNPG